MRNIRVLVLEDDLETNENILRLLREIENEKEVCFSVSILSDYVEVEEYVNKNPQIRFDVLLLDRDCFLGGSFHVVNLDYFDKDKIVSISSVPKYNKDAKKLGVRRSVWKDYKNMKSFKEKLRGQLIEIVE